ncbi:MAG: hypothetical protein ABIH27_06055 [Candidatus Omnitrophota bacterium]
MEKKISVVIITIAIVDFILAFNLLFMFFNFGMGSQVANISSNLRHPLIPFLYGFCLSLPVLIAAVSTIKFRRLGRRLNIYIFVLGVLLSLAPCLGGGMRYLIEGRWFQYEFVRLLFSVAILVFLFLPKVKEQFK